TGYNQANVNGTIHNTPDGSTAQTAADLLTAYNYLNTLPVDIELLYPAQFGNNLVLTPHVYRMNGSAAFTDSLYLNAMGNTNAVFVIQVNGAFSTSTYSKVKLINGTQAKNVYWKIEGAVTINNYSVFKGTLICNNGSIGAVNTGVIFDGSALITAGALSTAATTIQSVNIPANCLSVGIPSYYNAKNALTIYPNPFSTSLVIELNDAGMKNTYQFKIYNSLGKEVLTSGLIEKNTVIETNQFASGIYYYTVFNGTTMIQSGKLISQ
ncbi:MAG: ice-binding family protein, partial [Bacteroidia bacterium]